MVGRPRSADAPPGTPRRAGMPLSGGGLCAPERGGTATARHAVWSDRYLARSAYPIVSAEGLGGFVDDLAVAAWLVLGAEAKQGLERGVRVAAAVVAEHEFVEIGLEVLA